MKILVIGNGGREHALAWKFAQSPRVSEVLVAPGNAGTATEAKCRNVPVAAMDIAGLVALARTERVALTVVGPEGPLVAGVVDAFEAAGLACFGPKRLAARLEGSKQFTKEFLTRHGIPTARYAAFTRATFDRAGDPRAAPADRRQGGRARRRQGRDHRRKRGRSHPGRRSACSRAASATRAASS